MPQFAVNTDVSVDKSKAEIERIVSRYGAHGFMSGWQGSQAMVAFEMRNRQLRFLLPLPNKTDKAFTLTPSGKNKRTEPEAYKAWEQACRQKWRALALAIKAKLEAVDSGIGVFDDEFMAYVVLPGNVTISERIGSLDALLEGQKLPPLLPGPK